MQTLFLLIGLYLLSLLLNYAPLFSAFGLERSNHAALVLFSLLSGPATFYLAPLMNLLSRKHEYEADHFAVRTLRDGKAMEEALINLTVKNLSNLTPHPWYSAYYYSHPTPSSGLAQSAAVQSDSFSADLTTRGPVPYVFQASPAGDATEQTCATQQ